MAGGSPNKGWADERYRVLIRRLIEARLAKDLSQEALATRLSRKQQFVSKVETGERRLDVVEFADFARALELDPAQLVRKIP